MGPPLSSVCGILFLFLAGVFEEEVLVPNWAFCVVPCPRRRETHQLTRMQVNPQPLRQYVWSRLSRMTN